MNRRKGVTYAQSLAWDLFENYLQAARILGVDIEWKDGKLTAATIRAGRNSSGHVRVVYSGREKKLFLAPGAKAELN